MVEIDVFLEPLFGEVALIGVEESSVDWVQVLHSSLGGNEGVGWFKCWGIGGLDAERIPSLFALWVNSVGKVEVCVDLLENIEGKLFLLACESFQEDDLEVAVVIVELGIVVRGRFASEFDIFVGKSS